MKPSDGSIAVGGDLGNAGVVDRAQEGVAVVPEVGALVGEAFEHPVVAGEAFVDHGLEALAVGGQQVAHRRRS